MSTATRLFLVAAAAAVFVLTPASSQPKPGAPCKILTLDEATAILGPGTQSEMAVPDGKARMCTFSNGAKKLSVSAVDEGPLATMRKDQLEQLRKENKGKAERGIGDFAVSFTDGDISAVMAIKGGRIVDVRTTDAGSPSALLKPMLSAAKALLER
jgi:hypothetical protein